MPPYKIKSPQRLGSRYFGRLRLKCDGTRAEARFWLSAKRTSPFKTAGASVQSTIGSRGVCISGSNAGYTKFRSSEGNWLPTPFASFPFTSSPVRHRVPSHFNWTSTTDTFASEWGIAERGIFMAIHSNVNENFIFENTLLHYSHQKKSICQSQVPLLLLIKLWLASVKENKITTINYRQWRTSRHRNKCVADDSQKFPKKALKARIADQTRRRKTPL